MFLFQLLCTTMMGQLAFCIYGGGNGSNQLFQAFGYITRSQERNKPTCGATLITNRHIITLASCLHDWNENELYVQFGVTDWCKGFKAPYAQWSYFTNVYVEDYADPDGALAIAILAVTIREIEPMSPPLIEGQGADDTAVICGFGVYNPNTLWKSCELRQAEVVVRHSHPACLEQSGLICADPNTDSLLAGSMCYEDQGGPLVQCINNGLNVRCLLTGIQWKTLDGSCTGTNLARRVNDVVEWINTIIEQS